MLIRLQEIVIAIIIIIIITQRKLCFIQAKKKPVHCIKQEMVKCVIRVLVIIHNYYMYVL